VLREKLREAPLNGGVSILRQECTKAGAHVAQQRGRQYIDVSSKAIDTYETQLCEMTEARELSFGATVE
jgi:hypothetical protein